MPTYRRRQRRPRPERAPPAQSFARRQADLRARLPADAAAAGDQALKLLEEYLESLARSHGYNDEGSLRRYAMFLRGRMALDEELIARIDTYTDARNCLAHTYGLQTTPEFAAEVLDFVGLLLKRSALTAAQLMTEGVRAVDAAEPLVHARDLMLRDGYGRLPVMGQGRRIVGLLTERDVVAAQALAEREQRPLAALSVADALPPGSIERVAFAAPDTPRDAIVDLLRRPGVVAALVTPRGQADAPPIGIVTHADLLYRT